MLRFTISGIAAILCSNAVAGEFFPSDYSPNEDAVIKTLRIEKDGSYRQVVVAIANRSSKPFNANYGCTLLDSAGSPFDATGGAVNAVPPGQEVISKTISFQADAAGAACRIELVISD
ncbi:hypothetical protein [Mycoplana ramosa]|uniref:DUF2141 domain-containing protein n=1 Tax=Mycoplana ramosa TaxID=40837 RepID=A0ABW3YWG1_MYCRA